MFFVDWTVLCMNKEMKIRVRIYILPPFVKSIQFFFGTSFNEMLSDAVIW